MQGTGHSWTSSLDCERTDDKMVLPEFTTVQTNELIVPKLMRYSNVLPHVFLALQLTNASA